MICHIISLFGLYWLVVSQNTPAPAITDNHYGSAAYVPLIHGPGPLAGTFDFKAFVRGVSIAFNINGFNASDDVNYTYHIHERPVPPNGNCSATGDHFDPYHVGSAHKCDPHQSELCQLGDLSGKHGSITVDKSAPGFATAYQDDFLSTTIENRAFFANLSLVVHRKRDGYRLNCGNFTIYGTSMVENVWPQITANGSNIPSPGSKTPAAASTSSAGSDSFSMTNVTSASIEASKSVTSSTSLSATSVSTATPQGIKTFSGNGARRNLKASLLTLAVAGFVPVAFL